MDPSALETNTVGIIPVATYIRAGKKGYDHAPLLPWRTAGGTDAAPAKAYAGLTSCSLIIAIHLSVSSAINWPNVAGVFGRNGAT